MKLLLLLSDEAQIANRREAELRDIQMEKEEAQKKLGVLLDELRQMGSWQWHDEKPLKSEP